MQTTHRQQESEGQIGINKERQRCTMKDLKPRLTSTKVIKSPTYIGQKGSAYEL